MQAISLIVAQAQLPQWSYLAFDTNVKGRTKSAVSDLNISLGRALLAMQSGHDVAPNADID